MSFENEHVSFWSRFLIGILGLAYCCYSLVYTTEYMIPLTYNGVIFLILTLIISSAAWTGVIRMVIEDHFVKRAVYEVTPEDFMTGGEVPR